MYAGGMMKKCQRCGCNIIIGISRLSYNQRTALGENICKCISPSTENISEIETLKQQLAEAQSYKADAERYKIIRNIYTKNIDSWTKQEKSIYRIISTEDTNNRRFDEAIDQAMKEGKDEV